MDFTLPLPSLRLFKWPFTTTRNARRLTYNIHLFIQHFCPFARIITFYATNKVPASKQALRHKHLTLLRQIISPYPLSTSYNNAINSRWLRALVSIKLTVYVTVPTMWFIFKLHLLQDQCVGPIKYVGEIGAEITPVEHYSTRISSYNFTTSSISSDILYLHPPLLIAISIFMLQQQWLFASIWQ